MVTPVGIAASTAAAAGAATAKSESPTDPLTIVVVNPNYNEAHWGTTKEHCRPIRTVVEDCRATNPLPSSPYNTSFDCCLLYHIKGMCNGRCGKSAVHKPHTADQDAPLVT